MKEKTIVFDIDGCLADFVEGFTKLGHVMFGLPITTALEQETWDNFGGTKEQKSAIWEVLKQDELFWYSLKPLVDTTIFAKIDTLSLFNRVYFLTTRVGVKAKQQTERWLHLHGVYQPTVIISGLHDKGHICKYLGATHALEDKWENASSISQQSEAKSYLLNRPYNITPVYGRRVLSVGSFLDEVEHGSY